MDKNQIIYQLRKEIELQQLLLNELNDESECLIEREEKIDKELKEQKKYSENLQYEMEINQNEIDKVERELEHLNKEIKHGEELNQMNATNDEVAQSKSLKLREETEQFEQVFDEQHFDEINEEIKINQKLLQELFVQYTELQQKCEEEQQDCEKELEVTKEKLTECKNKTRELKMQLKDIEDKENQPDFNRRGNNYLVQIVERKERVEAFYETWKQTQKRRLNKFESSKIQISEIYDEVFEQQKAALLALHYQIKESIATLKSARNQLNCEFQKYCELSAKSYSLVEKSNRKKDVQKLLSILTKHCDTLIHFKPLAKLYGDFDKICDELIEKLEKMEID